MIRQIPIDHTQWTHPTLRLYMAHVWHAVCVKINIAIMGVAFIGPQLRT